MILSRAAGTVIVFLLTLSIHAEQSPFGSLYRERALSEPQLVSAAGRQSVPLVATDGRTTLAAWDDERGGVFVSPLGRRGEPLAPSGILIEAAAGKRALVWNGSEYALFVERGTEHVLVLLDSTGTILQRRTLESVANCRFTIAAWTGRDARAMYSCGSRRTLLDGTGAIAGSIDVTTVPTAMIVFATASDFVFLEQPLSAAVQNLSAPRVSRNAEPRAPLELVPPSGSYIAAAAADRGFVVLAYDSGGLLYAHAIDGAGKVVRSTLLTPLGARAAILADGDGYLVAWAAALGSSASGVVLGRLSADGILQSSVVVRQWSGFGEDIALSSGADGPLLTYSMNFNGGTGVDVVTHAVSSSLAVGDAALLSLSAETESVATVTAGPNGYLVTWTSVGEGTARRLHARRYSANGVPQGEAVVVSQDVIPRVSVAASGPVYMILWGEVRLGTAARRMNALTGEWIDEKPETISFYGDTDVASNGTDFVAAWAGPCSSAVLSCVRAQRLSATGPMKREPPYVVSDKGYHESVRIASNGSESLALWVTGTVYTGVGGPVEPFSVAAVRLAADGMPLDGAPILIDEKRGYPQSPAVAWSGADYVIAWSDLQLVRSARVTDLGAVFDRRDVLIIPREESDGTVALVRHSDGVYAAVHSRARANAADRTWSLLRLQANRPSVLVFRDVNILADTLAMASRADALAFAYNRFSAAAGHVPRAFLAVTPSAVRRRAIKH